MPHRPWKQVQVNQKGSFGVGGLELVPCPPSSPRGEAQLGGGRNRVSPRNGTPGWTPTHVSGSQDGSVEGIRDQMATGAVGERSGQRCPGSEMGQGQRM